MIDLDSLEINKEDEVEDTSVLDLGVFSDEKMEDSIIGSWNQLFNELVDEGEERIDRKFGEVRRKEDITNSAKSIIQDYVQKIKENLGANIDKVEHYLYGFLKKNYSVADEDDVEKFKEQE